MNMLTRKIARFRERLADVVAHLSWGCLGQECDCGHQPNMNWLARRTLPYWDDLDENDNPKAMMGRVWQTLGESLYSLTTWLINGKLMRDYYAECQMQQAKAENDNVKTRKKRVVLKAQDRRALALAIQYGSREDVKRVADEFNVSVSTAYRIRKQEDMWVMAQWEAMMRRGPNSGGIDDAMSTLKMGSYR